MEKKAPKAECQLSFDRPPSYLTLLNRIEQEPTTLKLKQVNYHIKAAKEYVLRDNWTRIVGDEGAIKLAVSVIARSISFAILLVSSIATYAIEVCKPPVQYPPQGHVEWSYAKLAPFMLQA